MDEIDNLIHDVLEMIMLRKDDCPEFDSIHIKDFVATIGVNILGIGISQNQIENKKIYDEFLKLFENGFSTDKDLMN